MKATVNIIENIGIFIPMGIFLPIVCKNLNKNYNYNNYTC